MMTSRRAVLAWGLVLTGCASAPPPRHANAWSGRLGLQVDGDPPQSLHAAFELEGDAVRGELQLLSPVGSTLARLSWTPEQATLERGAERWTQPSVDQLAQQLVQTPLPIQTLFDWIEGRATRHEGWEADLSARAQGRITARRITPGPGAVLRIVLDP